MREEPQTNKNYQLKLVKSTLAMIDPKSKIIRSKLDNKNIKMKENQNSKVKDVEYEKIGKKLEVPI